MDLEVSSPEDAQVKAQLTAKIAEIITTAGLTQAGAARILGVDQPSVSALLRGRLSGFSIDRLLNFVIALGRDVHIVIRTQLARGCTRPGQRPFTKAPRK